MNPLLEKKLTLSVNSFCLVFVLSFMACQSGLDLEVRDKRPVYSLDVGDGEEIDILKQELELEIITVSNNTIYFYAEDPTLTKRLKEVGYAIGSGDAAQITYKVVKVKSHRNEQLSVEKATLEFLKYNIIILRRENDYWAIQGSLADLKKIQEAGYRLEELKSEVRPRSVKISVPSVEDVQKVNEMDVDIYSSERTENNGVTIYGAAFDYQIDLMKAAGYEVTILD